MLSLILLMSERMMLLNRYSRAGRIWPVTSPKQILVPSAAGAVALIATSSPSSRKLRTDPSASVRGSAPPQLSSSRQPRWSRSGPLTVPEANRSPVRVEAPFTVMWASICAAVQYVVAYGGGAAQGLGARHRRARPVGGRVGGARRQLPVQPHLELEVQAPRASVGQVGQ